MWFCLLLTQLTYSLKSLLILSSWLQLFFHAQISLLARVKKQIYSNEDSRHISYFKNSVWQGSPCIFCYHKPPPSSGFCHLLPKTISLGSAWRAAPGQSSWWCSPRSHTAGRQAWHSFCCSSSLGAGGSTAGSQAGGTEGVSHAGITPDRWPAGIFPLCQHTQASCPPACNKHHNTNLVVQPSFFVVFTEKNWVRNLWWWYNASESARHTRRRVWTSLWVVFPKSSLHFPALIAASQQRAAAKQHLWLLLEAAVPFTLGYQPPSQASKQHTDPPARLLAAQYSPPSWGEMPGLLQQGGRHHVPPPPQKAMPGESSVSAFHKHTVLLREERDCPRKQRAEKVGVVQRHCSKLKEWHWEIVLICS